MDSIKDALMKALGDRKDRALDISIKVMPKDVDPEKLGLAPEEKPHEDEAQDKELISKMIDEKEAEEEKAEGDEEEESPYGEDEEMKSFIMDGEDKDVALEKLKDKPRLSLNERAKLSLAKKL